MRVVGRKCALVTTYLEDLTYLALRGSGLLYTSGDVLAFGAHWRYGCGLGLSSFMLYSSRVFAKRSAIYWFRGRHVAPFYEKISGYIRDIDH